MGVSFQQHALAFFRSFALGAVIFLVYLTLELLRIMVPPGRIRLFVEDVLFAVLVSILDFLFALSQTDSSVRGFSLLAQLAAFVLLYVTAGRLCKYLVRKSRGFIVRTALIIFRPVRKGWYLCVLNLQKGWPVFVKRIKIEKKEKK